MSNRSANLLLEVAKSIELSRRGHPLKLAGGFPIHLNTGLIFEIETWVRGYKEYVERRKRG